LYLIVGGTTDDQLVEGSDDLMKAPRMRIDRIRFEVCGNDYSPLAVNAAGSRREIGPPLV